jgi:hypothetical protein
MNMPVYLTPPILKLTMETLIALSIGITLLFLEHKTSWFQNTTSSHISRRAKNLSEEKIEITSLDLAVRQFYWVVGTLLIVSPVSIALAREWHNNQVSQQQARIDAYEQSDKWELPQTLAQLNDVSRELSLALEERKKFKSLQESNNLLARDKASLELKLSSSQKEKSEAISQLSRLENLMVKPQSLSLNKDDTVDVFGGAYKLGLESIYDGFVIINVGNISGNLSVGEQLEVDVANRKCYITLSELNYSQKNAKFSSSCEKL